MLVDHFFKENVGNMWGLLYGMKWAIWKHYWLQQKESWLVGVGAVLK